MIGYLGEAIRMVAEAGQEGITMRVMGAIAIRIHCPKYASLHSELKRLGEGDHPADFTDIDFVSLNEFAGRLPSFFDARGYKRLTGGIALAVQGFGRQMYRGEETSVDVFIDRLVMSHTVDLRNRIKLDSPTISPSDLLLEKLQIVEIDLKDIKDIVVLLREHSVEDSDEDAINRVYIARLLAKDWGLCHTCLANLSRIDRHFLNQLTALSDSDRRDVHDKITAITQAIHDEPKPVAWKLRDRAGSRIRWHEEVSELK